MNKFQTSLVAASIALLIASPVLAGGIVAKGVKAGVSFAKMAYDSPVIDSDTDHDLGLAAGGFVRFGLAPRLTLQPEILYVQQGGKRDGTATDEQGDEVGDVTAHYNLDYIQIPVLLRLDSPAFGALGATFMIGPVVGFAVNTEESFEGDGLEDDVTNDLDGLKDLDYGVIFGVGLDMGAGPASWTLDLRYNLGLSDINDLDNGTEIRNRGFQALVGYAF